MKGALAKTIALYASVGKKQIDKERKLRLQYEKRLHEIGKSTNVQGLVWIITCCNCKIALGPGSKFRNTKFISRFLVLRDSRLVLCIDDMEFAWCQRCIDTQFSICLLCNQTCYRDHQYKHPDEDIPWMCAKCYIETKPYGDKILYY